MMRRLLILLLTVILSAGSVFAKNDSIAEPKKHNPEKATLYSAILPGLGQAYNKKYWKIPVVYAGIGTIGYFAITNGNGYRDYRLAYDYQSGITTDVSDDIKVLAGKYSAENLITIRDYYRRNMELSWIIMALWYGLNIIDATVDAHFFEYDIGDDLTLKVEPTLQTNYAYWDAGYGYGYGYGYGSGSGNGNGYGISLKLKF